MSFMVISIPPHLRLKEVLETSRQIRDLPQQGDVQIDFGQMGIAGPFALLMLSSALSRLRNEKPGLTIQPRNYVQHRYYGHMGFFRASGFQYGREPGEAIGSDVYIPITKQGISPWYQEYKDTGRPLGELVEEEAKTFAEMLCRGGNSDVQKVLVFAIREIMRNTAEHSRSPSIEFCAQYWKEADRVEIAIIDRGVGIYNSLKTNPSLSIQDERHAINMALLPGISRNVRLDNPLDIRGVWQNSGFGLFMTQRLCRFGGDFFLASGSSGKFLQNEKARWFDFGFEGTAVRMVMRPSSIGDLSLALKKFDDEAKRIAKENGITIPNASTASRMVNLNFYDIR